MCMYVWPLFLCLYVSAVMRHWFPFSSISITLTHFGLPFSTFFTCLDYFYFFFFLFYSFFPPLRTQHPSFQLSSPTLVRVAAADSALNTPSLPLTAPRAYIEHNRSGLESFHTVTRVVFFPVPWDVRLCGNASAITRRARTHTHTHYVYLPTHCPSGVQCTLEMSHRFKIHTW